MKAQAKKWGKRGIAAALGIMFAFFLESVLTLYQINRGYGREEAFPLVFVQSNDYAIGGDDGSLWIATGIDPWVIFHPEKKIGHIRICFKEPLTEDKSVMCFYANHDGFQGFQRKYRFLLEGTKEAYFTVPYGGWDSYRLSISGDFILDKLEGVEAVPLREIQADQVFCRLNQKRLLAFAFIFCLSGLLFVEKRERKKEKAKDGGLESGTGKPRVVYFDAVRAFAALLVILVHVVVPMETLFNLSANMAVYRVFWCFRFLLISCNTLFFMLSGALLLPWREESWREFVHKRLMKVVLPLLVYGGIYLVFLCGSQVSLREWIPAYTVRMIEGRVGSGPHLWMVFELIGMYILVFPLRAFLKNASEQTEKMLAVFILVLTAIRSIAYVYKIEIVVSTFLSSWTGVFLFGYLMNKAWMRRYDRLWIWGGLVMIVSGAFLGVQEGGPRYIFGNSVFVLVIACGIFSAMLRLERYLQKIKKFLFFCSKYSYSILLIHWFVLNDIVYIRGLSPFMSKTSFVLCASVSCILLSLLSSIAIDHTIVAVLEEGICRGAGLVRSCLRRK